MSARASGRHRASGPGNARLIFAALLASTALTGAAIAQERGRETALLAQAPQTAAFDIPAQGLSSAITSFIVQSGYQVSIDQPTLAGLRSSAVSGRMAPEDALRRLLAGTGLTWRATDARSVYLMKASGPGVIQLDPLNVEGRVQGAETAFGSVPGYVATRSASATKTDTPLIETPRAVTVIGREQIETQKAENLQQALRYAPGVFAESSGVQPFSDNFYIRGFAQSTANPNIYQDGMLRVPQAPLETYGIERIEMVRGPASVLYGQNAPGGLTNLVTKRPTDTPQHEIQIQGGSFERRQGAFDLGGPIDDAGKTSYRLTGLLRDAETQIDSSRDDRAFIAGAFGWKPTERTSITVFADYQKDEVNFFFGLPAAGTALGNPNGRIPNTRNLGEPGFDRDDVERSSAGYVAEHRFESDWTIRQNLRYSRADISSFQVSNGGLQADQRTISRSVLYRPRDATLLSIDNQVERKLATGDVQHTLLAGLDYRQLEQNSLTRTATAPSLDLYAPVYGRALVVPPVTANSNQDQDQIAIYGQEQMKIGERWIVALGGRQDWAESETVNRLTNVTTTQADKAFTGQAGLVYLTEIGLAPYVNYAKSFLPVLGTAFGGAPFRPETGKQYEAGLKYEPKFMNASATASVFDIRRQNVTTLDPAHPGFNTQTGEVRSRGFEISGTASPVEGLNVIAGYSYVDAEVTKSNGTDLGKQPFRVPTHAWSLWGDYSFQDGPLQGFGFGSGLRYIGSSAGDTTNSFTVPSYTLVDAMLRYEIGGYRFALNATNLFDTYYVAGCFAAANGCNLGQARTVLGTLTYRW